MTSGGGLNRIWPPGLQTFGSSRPAAAAYLPPPWSPAGWPWRPTGPLAPAGCSSSGRSCWPRWTARQRCPPHGGLEGHGDTAMRLGLFLFVFLKNHAGTGVSNVHAKRSSQAQINCHLGSLFRSTHETNYCMKAKIRRSKALKEGKEEHIRLRVEPLESGCGHRWWLVDSYITTLTGGTN